MRTDETRMGNGEADRGEATEDAGNGLTAHGLSAAWPQPKASDILKRQLHIQVFGRRAEVF